MEYTKKEHIKEKIALGVFIFSILALSIFIFSALSKNQITGEVIEEVKEQLAEQQQQITCSDSDKKDYSIKGIINYCNSKECLTKEDSCSGKKLIEWYCEVNEAKYEEHECKDECDNGICLNAAINYNYVIENRRIGGSNGGTTISNAQGGEIHNLGELSSEQTLEIVKDDTIRFTISTQEYLLNLIELTESRVTINNNGVEINIKVGEETSGISGVYLKLRSINTITKKAKLTLSLA